LKKGLSSPRVKPLLIFDGDCNFCRRWIYRWHDFTQDRVEYRPYQEVSAEFPEIPLEDFKTSVQLIEGDGQIYEAAEAVFRTLSRAPGKGWMLWVYQRLPLAQFFTEGFYRLVARNRIVFSRLTGFLWGSHLEPPRYQISRDLFLRILGGIYLAAFLSFWSQLEGLIGSNGILPVKNYLQAVRDQIGPAAYWALPTLAWVNPSDGFLHLLCGGGVLLSLLLLAGVAPALLLTGLWSLYLSLVVAGQVFMEFQWDVLLLETGFLAIFLAPLTISPRRWGESPPSRAVLWLLKWLLFRLLLSSGVVKLTSGDEAWRSLTALSFHYETQPLPTWISWYAHQLPAWFQKGSCLGMFVVELAIPFLIFAPRRLRLFGCGVSIAFQILILVTGNYCFFNLLTIALCILLLDDAFWPQWMTKRYSGRGETRSWPRWVIAALMLVILPVSSVEMVSLFRRRMAWPLPVVVLYRAVAPFRSINGYGLFAVMTTSRPEIIVEGSRDGVTWFPYEFHWKPGDLKRRPGFVAPHQPRLDWQMWFAALGNYRMNPWFVHFMVRLLEGSPEVLRLLAKNPFPEKAPRYLRALVYDYHFTDPAARGADGSWWRREFKGSYLPVLSLEEGEQGAVDRGDRPG
jgi:predicted DCC family thiol-disulfide oxidoreductase YuxK